MSPLAEKLYELIQLLAREDREKLLDKIREDSESQSAESSDQQKISDLPTFTGGKWLAGRIGRDEIYSDESEHALPR